MRISPLMTVLITVLAAALAVIVVGVLAALLVTPPRALLTDTSVSLQRLTVDSGAALIRYTLNRNAAITIGFQRKNDNAVYVFRKAEARPVNTYQVYFNGIVDGFALPGDPSDDPTNTIDARLIPNGEYTWNIAAKSDSGETAQASGSLSVDFADTALPLIQDFSVTPAIFTPNQDGVNDRVAVNTYLAKKATLTVYLEGADGIRYYVPERIGERQPGDMGAHSFDYDGGVDNKVTPPPNGTYTLVAIAEDREGQRTHRTSHVTIKDGGLPQVEIQPQTTGSTIRYTTQPFIGAGVRPPEGVGATQATLNVTQGDLLSFRMTIYNYGKTPIRTLGPWPGTVYQDYQTDAVFTNKELVTRDGAWRVGFQCDTSETTLPWRWAVGAPDELQTVTDDKGDTFYYLLPGQSATVWGAVRLNRLIKTRNPQDCWASLIHESVDIPNTQSYVGPIKVQLIATP